MLSIVALSACSSGSNAHGAPVNATKAQQVLTNIVQKSKEQTNYRIEYKYHHENGFKANENGPAYTTFEKEEILMEMTVDRYFHIKYISIDGWKDALEQEQNVRSYEFFYGNVRNEDIAYFYESSDYNDYSYTVAYVGAYDYETDLERRIPNDLEKPLSFEEYIYAFDDLSVAAMPSGSGHLGNVSYKIKYYSKNDLSIYIDADLQVDPYPGDYGMMRTGSKGVLGFDDGRISIVTEHMTFEDDREKSFNDTEMTFSYPQNLAINIPTDWNQYVAN